MKEAYFHEDDYCQIELLPVANYQHCRDQLGEIESFSQQHEAEFGWAKMFLRPNAPLTLIAARITTIAIQQALESFMPKVNRVMTGYGMHKERCPNTIAFGEATNLILFADHNGEFITNLWLTIYGLSVHDTERASRMFRMLSQWELLLVDWSMNAIVALDNTDALGNYLAEFRINDNS